MKTETIWARLADDVADEALSLAHGSYQRALLLGRQRWSGADLVGTARQYGREYARSRRNLRRRLEAAGIPVTIEIGKHGRLILVVGHPQETT